MLNLIVRALSFMCKLVMVILLASAVFSHKQPDHVLYWPQKKLRSVDRFQDPLQLLVVWTASSTEYTTRCRNLSISLSLSRTSTNTLEWIQKWGIPGELLRDVATWNDSTRLFTSFLPSVQVIIGGFPLLPWAVTCTCTSFMNAFPPYYVVVTLNYYCSFMLKENANLHTKHFGMRLTTQPLLFLVSVEDGQGFRATTNRLIGEELLAARKCVICRQK